MMTVQDVMTTAVISVGRETPLKEVARLLVDRGISGVPVVDTAGNVIGVVSEGDLLVKEQGPEAIHHRPLARILGDSADTRHQVAKIAAVTAGQAMTAPALTVEPHTRIADAAALMTARKVNRLPVVSHGRLIGIVTRADLVRAYARTDEELAQTIRQDVLLRILWLDPDTFDVSVLEGAAKVSGHVERRSTADMLERILRMVPGIVDASVDVTWRRDDTRLEPVERDAVFPFGPR